MTATSEKASVSQNGQKILDDEEENAFEKLKSLDIGDCIGCGYCPYKNTVFFTLNGQKLTPKIKLSPSQKNDQSSEIVEYYPTIAFRSKEKVVLDLIF